MAKAKIHIPCGDSEYLCGSLAAELGTSMLCTRCVKELAHLMKAGRKRTESLELTLSNIVALVEMTDEASEVGSDLYVEVMVAKELLHPKKGGAK